MRIGFGIHHHLHLLFVVCVVLSGRVVAQNFNNLHSFAGGIDGSKSYGGLVLSSNILYGATSGFTSGFGTVFRLFTDGTGFTNLRNFAGYPAEADKPLAGLILSGNKLYGTSGGGGSSGYGTVFALSIDGADFTTLHNFTATLNYPPYSNSDGTRPSAELIRSGETLYGTTVEGGDWGDGVVFKMKTDGTGFATLHSFTATNGLPLYRASVVLSGSTLYGTTIDGGDSGMGTIFALNTDGTGFRTVHSFTGTNTDGGMPYSSLTVSGDTLYGTAIGGGSSVNGTVFSVRTDGTQFKTLYSFTRRGDGAGPRGALILSGNALYGIAAGGGSSDQGTVFALNIDGTGYQSSSTGRREWTECCDNSHLQHTAILPVEPVAVSDGP